MNTPAKMFSAVRSCSRITNYNSFYISRRFFKNNPKNKNPQNTWKQWIIRQFNHNNKNPPKTWKQWIIWQFWRPMTNPESGRMDFWNFQYNAITWTLIIFITLNLVFPAKDYDNKSWVKRFWDSLRNGFQEPKESEGDYQGENTKPIEENRARVRRAIEARKIAKLSEENRTKSIAEQLAALDDEK
jgi:hypothetical protein